MKESDKNTDSILDEVFGHSSLDTPSFDFTSKVMDQIMQPQVSLYTTYRPLISKWSWAIISMLLLLLFGYFGMQPAKGSSLPNFLYQISLPSIRISSITAYALLAIILFFGVQVILLKKYFAHNIDQSL